MLKKLFRKLNTTVMGGAILISVFSILSKILGLVRDRMLAHRFGAGEILDSYFASFRIPDLIFNTLILGALASAFVPVFVKLNKNDKERATYASNSILNIIVLILTIIAFIIYWKVDFFVKILVPGFNSFQLDLTAHLTKIMLLSVIIFGAGNVMSSLLNSYKSYFVYSLAPLLYNLGIIFGIIMSKFYGYYALAWGVVLGSFLHFVVQFFAVLRHGWKYKFVIDFKDFYVKKIISLMVPRTIGLAVNQINQVVITMIASGLVVGSIAVFSFGLNLQSVIVGIFGVSISIAMFPIMSDFADKENKSDFHNYLLKNIKRIAFLVVPISVAMILLRAQIVRIVLGTGNFDWQDTYHTAQVLGIFSISLIFQCLIPIISRAFYALENTKTPVIISIISLVINVVLSLVFGEFWGIEGIAIAFTLSNILNLIILIIVFCVKFRIKIEERLWWFVLKICINSAIMGVFIYIFRYLLSIGVNMNKFIGVFLQFLGSVIVGVIVYLVASLIIKVSEVDILKEYCNKFEKKLLGFLNNKKGI